MLMLFGKQIKKQDFAIASALFLLACITLYQWAVTTQLSKDVNQKQQTFNLIKHHSDTLKRLPQVKLPDNPQVTESELSRIFNRYAVKPVVIDKTSNGGVKLALESIRFNQLLQIMPLLQRSFIATETLTVSETEREGYVSVVMKLKRIN